MTTDQEIEKAVDAATAPLRADNVKLQHKAACLQQDRQDLRAELSNLKARADALEAERVEQHEFIGDLKAKLRKQRSRLVKADALRDNTKVLVDFSTEFCNGLGDLTDAQLSEKLGREVSGLRLALWTVKTGWSLDAYDAAPRAGETPMPPEEKRATSIRQVVSAALAATDEPDSEHPVFFPTPTDQDDALRARPATEESNLPEIPEGCPTDAAAGEEPLVGLAWIKSWIGEFGDGLRAHEARLDDIERKLDLTDPDNIINGEGTSGFDTRGLAVTAQYFADKANERLDALEAERTPVPEVTDEMMTAYWTASGTKDREDSVKRGLEAALALAAGGAT